MNWRYIPTCTADGGITGLDNDITNRDNGIVVPLTYNDPGEGKNFVNGTVSVNLFILRFPHHEEL